tara:strand:- start:16 stop:1041 length:1026 start_codon:yes stop_codon:yes gene_type:complete
MFNQFKVLAILLLTSTLLFSERNIPEIVTKVGTCAGNWLKLETGARAIGMGGAHVAAGDGIYAAPYNPASIGFVKGSDTYFSNTQYVAGITFNVLGYAKELTPGGTDFVGLHLFYMDSGEMLVTDMNNSDGYGEYFKVTGFSLRGIYTKMLTDRLKVGIALKYIRESIYTTYMQTFVLDIGSNFDTGIYGMILGMSVSNFGPEVQFNGEGLQITVPEEQDVNERLERITKKFPLPLTFRLGVKNDIIGPNPESSFFNIPGSRLTVSLDGINAMDYTVYGSFGMEYAWKEMFFARFGTHMGHDTAGLSLGGGLKYRGINIDYAYVDYGVLDITHQFGIGLQF